MPPTTRKPPAAASDDKPAGDKAPTIHGKALTPGQIVTWTAFDSYAGAGGENVTRTGIVAEVLSDPDSGESHARVAWLDATDPIPASALVTV